MEAVDRKPRKLIGFAEDNAAAVRIGPHDGFAVVPGVADPPLPEAIVKTVVGVAGEQANADL